MHELTPAAALRVEQCRAFCGPSNPIVLGLVDHVRGCPYLTPAIERHNRSGYPDDEVHNGVIYQGTAPRPAPPPYPAPRPRPDPDPRPRPQPHPRPSAAALPYECTACRPGTGCNAVHDNGDYRA